jgi:glycosyltransferase involved in cell wall biosynthesis/GT2 family glycosyltransferase
MSNEVLDVSIVINTLNRGPYLNDALRALQGLAYPRYEVIVVNGPSTDNSAAVLEGWAGRIKLETCPEANLAMSRNVGIQAAAGEVICFIDDDAAPHADWLGRLMEGYKSPGVGAVGGFTIDNTGTRWQVRKTICDRFGNAYNVSPFFDEGPLSFPGSPFFPSMLGTNSSFRASALRAIGGFDHAFAYLLDETDVCLRLVDAGWKVIYEPDALIYHQFAASHIRSSNRIARTLYPSARSKGYFISRHGAEQSMARAGFEAEKYIGEISQSTQWLFEQDQIDSSHRFSLDEDLARGFEDGRRLAGTRGEKRVGDLDADVVPPPFKEWARPGMLRVAFVSQGFPPDQEAGIARWTALAARGLAERGHAIHVLTRSASADESVVFQDGIWIHRICPDTVGSGPVAETYSIPESIAAWCARVRREVSYLKSFGLDLVSFPIWDLEGLPTLDDPEIAAVVSLHTTYAMAKPFKPEWNLRPIYEHHFVDRMIRAEGRALEKAGRLLANSEAVLSEIEATYGFDPRAKSTIVAHATPDPLERRLGASELRASQAMSGAALRVLFVGRFEPRKGFDLASGVIAELIQQSADIECWIVGDLLQPATRRAIVDAGHGRILDDPRVRFHGQVSRAELDDLYVQADVVLLPSRFESFGLVAIEAMAAGKPVVGLASGGLAEIIENGVSGRMWPDTEEVVGLMTAEILRLDGDRGALAEMGQAARRRYLENYTIASMTDGLEAFYRSVLEQRHGPVAAELENAR